MIVPKKIVHQRQNKDYNCGATALAILLNRSQEEAEIICQTNCKGTDTRDVVYALKLLKIPHFYQTLDLNFLTEMNFLDALSRKWPLYLTGHYKDRFHKKGRDRERHHAVAVADGVIYDPSYDEPIPIEAYPAVFNKSLQLTEIIVIDEERPDYLKNKD